MGQNIKREDWVSRQRERAYSGKGRTERCFEAKDGGDVLHAFCFRLLGGRLRIKFLSDC